VQYQSLRGEGAALLVELTERAEVGREDVRLALLQETGDRLVEERLAQLRAAEVESDHPVTSADSIRRKARKRRRIESGSRRGKALARLCARRPSASTLSFSRSTLVLKRWIANIERLTSPWTRAR
jgi:hypothetical protein